MTHRHAAGIRIALGPGESIIVCAEADCPALRHEYDYPDGVAASSSAWTLPAGHPDAHKWNDADLHRYLEIAWSNHTAGSALPAGELNDDGRG